MIFGEKVHHREAPEAIASAQADVAVIYHHLALRYTRIFGSEFSIVELPFDNRNVTTEYHAAVYNPDSELANKLVDFLFSEEVKTIYEYHGLQRL